MKEATSSATYTQQMQKKNAFQLIIWLSYI